MTARTIRIERAAHLRWHTGAAMVALLAGLVQPSVAFADETCQSPYMAKITGEEEFVCVWTVGVEGLGDGSDKLVTVDVRTGSPTFGQVIDIDSVGGRHERTAAASTTIAAISGWPAWTRARSSSSTSRAIPRTRVWS